MEDNTTTEEAVSHFAEYVPEEGDEGFTPKGQYYDTEYGDCPPSHIYESGMYLGDGVWVSQDFFG